MKLRALVIDDSRVMRNMVMESLRRTMLAEFEFVEAENGAEAVSKFNPRNIDICFIDWNMPKMSGIDFVRKVKAVHKGCDTPMVMVTSEKAVSKLEEALDSAGATAYIAKPFTVEYIKKKISPILEQLSQKPASKPQNEGGGGFFSKLLGPG